MQHAWDTVTRIDTSGMTLDAFQAHVTPCIHSTAIKSFHDSGRIPYGSGVEQLASSMEDIKFCSISHPITVLQCSANHLLLSCDFGVGDPCKEFTRAVIRTDRNRHYCCTHCPPGKALSCEDHIQPLAAWLDAHADSDVCDEVFEDFSVKATSKPQHDHPMDEAIDASSFRCVSNRRISIDFFNERMRLRSLCGEEIVFSSEKFTHYDSHEVLITSHYLFRWGHPFAVYFLP